MWSHKINVINFIEEQRDSFNIKTDMGVLWSRSPSLCQVLDFKKFLETFLEVYTWETLSSSWWGEGGGVLLWLLLSRFSLCPTLCDPIDGSPPGRPWDSPGKNTGVGCHVLLQCMKVRSEVAQSGLTLCDLMDCSLPGSSVHGIFQAKVLEWGAIAFFGEFC